LSLKKERDRWNLRERNKVIVYKERKREIEREERKRCFFSSLSKVFLS
jgi:hypothetical protein